MDSERMKRLSIRTFQYTFSVYNRIAYAEELFALRLIWFGIIMKWWRILIAIFWTVFGTYILFSTLNGPLKGVNCSISDYGYNILCGTNRRLPVNEVFVSYTKTWYTYKLNSLPISTYVQLVLLFSRQFYLWFFVDSSIEEMKNWKL